ncbi:hypothetical protein DH09_12110 [Bacillaceae bacterium JMAK1]|nr:hypothetical protein DH09_12110 [Bacillaceae bacterium JMAK1]
MLLIIIAVIAIALYPIQQLITSSTNLREESIEPFSLHTTLNEETLRSIGEFERSIQPNGYGYQSENYYVHTNDDHEITSISISEELQTSSGIHIGDSVEDWIDVYGDDYYTYQEMGLGDAIVYIDRDHTIKLTLWTMDDHVRYIWLSTY